MIFKLIKYLPLWVSCVFPLSRQQHQAGARCWEPGQCAGSAVHRGWVIRFWLLQSPATFSCRALLILYCTGTHSLTAQQCQSVLCWPLLLVKPLTATAIHISTRGLKTTSSLTEKYTQHGEILSKHKKCATHAFSNDNTRIVELFGEKSNI